MTVNVAGKKEIVGLEKNRVEKRRREGSEDKAHEASVKETAMRKIREMSIPEEGDNTKLPRQSPVWGIELGWVGLC